MNDNEIVIVEGVRTPQGLLGGAFRDFSAQKLGEVALRALIEKTKLNPAWIDEVIFGCVGQATYRRTYDLRKI